MSKWDKPKDVETVDIAFGPRNIDDLLPTFEEIPDEFHRGSRNKWNNIFSQWFFSGLSGDTKFVMKDDIDYDKAIRHIRSVMTSWAPKHERKEAEVSYLMSLWFEDIIIPEKEKV